MNLRELRNCLIQFASVFARYRPWTIPDKALEFIFVNKANNNITIVLQKVAASDSLYHNQLPDPYQMAQQYIFQNAEWIDERLFTGNVEVVQNIRWLGPQPARVNGRKGLYVFATKYAHWHNPSAFPIYDKYISQILPTLKSNCPEWRIEPFTTDALLNYVTLKHVIDELIQATDLTGANYKFIDQALWTWGQYKSRTRFRRSHPEALRQIELIRPICKCAGDKRGRS